MRRKLRINVGSSYANYFISIRNLGFVLDNTLRMEKKVNYKCKSCCYQIRNVGLICKYINDGTCNILAHAFIMYRLGYGNAMSFNNSQAVE